MAADFTSIDYTPQLDIRDTDKLPRGTGAGFLLCEYAEPGAVSSHETFYAVSWHRSYSAAMKRREKYGWDAVIVKFRKD